MTNFTLLGPNGITGNASWHLHATGCSDLARPKYRRADRDSFDADTVADALDCAIDPETADLGYSHDDVKVFPCCHAAVATAAANEALPAPSGHPTPDPARVLLASAKRERDDKLREIRVATERLVRLQDELAFLNTKVDNAEVAAR